MAAEVVSKTRYCDLCDQHVKGAGPWCELYTDRQNMCFAELHVLLEAADRTGDGPMVNAICEYGRKRYGACLHW